MPENEMTGEELLEELYKQLKNFYYTVMLSTIQAQKVTGANILFFGLGDGVTGQFEVIDSKNWKISFGKGEVE